MSDFLPFIVAGLTAGSVYGLAGTGLVLTYKTSGIFNFAHGTIAALVAYAFYDLRQRHGMPWPIALLLCMFVVSPLISLLLERMARRVADSPIVMKVVATVGLIIGIQQIIVIRYGAANITSRPFLPTRAYEVLGVNVGVDQMIVMAVALSATLGLTWLFVATRLGRSMTAVVDQPELLALTGASPVQVRRRAWYIGTAFAGLSGVLLAPSIGLEPTALTLLVVQAFGAAAIGMFTSIPLTYAGGLLIGVAASVSTKYVAVHPTLNGLPSSLPFIVLFAVLLVAPGRWLVDFTVERKSKVADARRLPRAAQLGGLALAVLVALRVPYVVGHRLPIYTEGLAFVIIFLSLLLLMRTSGQVSLAQLAFGAVGAAAASRFTASAAVPWVLGIVLAALVAVPVGALLAIPAIRRSGLYLALATFGFAVLLERLVLPTSLMFGGSAGGIPAPRPSFARGDRAYFYVVLAFVVAAIALVTLIHRSRLGRLLRAMSDTSAALTTYGTSVTTLKVLIFCVAAFLAGLGGALIGPVTGAASPGTFIAFDSLLLVVVSVIVAGGEIPAAIGAAFAHTVFPSYLSGSRFEALGDYLPLLFAVGALRVAMRSSHSATPMRVPAWLRRRVGGIRFRSSRGPATARVVTRASTLGS